jgi:hypothetical protein
MGVERSTIMNSGQRDDDEPTETCAELGSLVREAVEQIRPEVAAVIWLLHDLMKSADELEARGDAVCQPGSSTGDLLSVTACHLPNEMRAVAVNLRRICDLLKLPETVGGNI